MFNNKQPLFDVKATSNSNVRTTTCASSRNVLTKASDEVTIKSYFEGVHELLKSKGSDAFCVDLDEVWPLVYERKDVAVRALTKDYFEGVDYTTQVSDNQTLRRNGEQDSKGSCGGSNKVTYYLTVSCLEYLIARKERRVFEVYRQVFHQAMDNASSQSQISTKDKIEAEFIAAKYCAEILNMNDASKLMVTRSIADAYGLQLSLPAYASSKGVTKSLTECLKLVGSELKPKEFNRRLADKGFIVQNTRYSSSKKKDVPFWTITNKGLAYGENKVHPHNQNETQPCWYVDKFKELYNLMK